MKSKINWTAFSKKEPEERIAMLSEKMLLSSANQDYLKKQALLPLDVANQMTENVIGRLALPFSLVPNVNINGDYYQVPFVTEEPSVVAAASYASKIIDKSGGFKTKLQNRQMIGQVALYHCDDLVKSKMAIKEAEKLLLDIANQAYPSIVKRGGGAKSLWTEEKDEFLIVYLSVDTQEAMGANMLNTMLEAISSELEKIAHADSLMAILSNYATESLVTATCEVRLNYLSRNKEEAKILAKKIELASKLAQVDIYRATTHNKGILNGIDAIVLTTGNDWRAIESACHAFACKDGQYRGLSQWQFNTKTQKLEGQLTLPMPIATKGGSIGLNPSVQIAHDCLGNPKAKELAQIIVAMGLAQNFAALKALTNQGIQAGHMKLQAKSLALLAGAQHAELPLLMKQLIKSKPMNLETAKSLLESIRNEN
ncbi:hydroxymethylglutaryl-CoA reductase, degradative [Streptococcus urinalis FB127-CNA-2]|uniref:3-hydroxy-3-methylglutaryl coenzyme A reductase n=1 Tax=Streptococcus urinalis 2285-97 TaxID=764291 RepID=G5KFG9_9STRE|nr:hydroxymethylglutaryl-CoA reductase, degradative [Streptococcus urinalis]EHJ56003.1 hydroxymethylglutaryl-CoA reductase, degradative [Streptococcus urinalis 2285-97]EKS22070.1 hydroxymethylglutaryl-CoA reductase, degradative [Streptococcus urinalis FB127-CNA-2]VEF31882.1 hydroxymethylglutaryl-CoA reductase, degradative [Streptococcus urinalis]